ncbi:MAG: NRDE family protein [Steroidobacteraceae bacterium]
MCLILVAWQVHPDYPLVLAANRDEIHARAATPAAWWPQPHILAGRDSVAGGTWLGVTRTGSFAALTNYRDAAAPQLPDAPSRGAIVPQTLSVPLPANERLQQLERSSSRYHGFNLLFGDADSLAVFESVPGRGRLLGPGVYGLSNHLLDTPWPKVVGAKAALAAALTHLPDQQALLQLLRDEAQADDRQLPRTGLSIEWERLLSSAFIRSPDYGTRCSTILLIDRAGQARFTELTWNAGGTLAGEVEYQFRSAATGAQAQDGPT